MKKLIRVCASVLAGVVLASGVAWATAPAEVGEEEPVLLEVFSMPANSSGFMDNWWADILLEEINVQLELLPAGDQGEQKLQALMAGGELPDIVVFKDKKQVEDAVRADMLASLDANIAALPNVATNAAVSLQFYRDTASAGTGEAYAVANTIGPGEAGENLNWGPHLRWDLYSGLGKPRIRTLEDYLDVIESMLELEPETADGQNVYGFTLWKDWDSNFSFLATQLGSLYGVDSGGQMGAKTPFLQIDAKTGETMSILDPDSFYIRTLRFYFEANQRGLVDPDSPTQRFDGAWSKIENGRVLFSLWPWFGGRFNTPENVNAEPPRGFMPVIAEDLKPWWPSDNPIGANWPYAISSATEQLDAALAYLDFMYSHDGLMQLINGPRGLTWDVDTAGSPYVTDEGWNIIEDQLELPGGGELSDGTGIVNSYGLSFASINPEFGVSLSYAYWPTSQGRNPSKLVEDWQQTTGFPNHRELIRDHGFTYLPMDFVLAPSIPDDILTLANQIGDVVKTNSWLMMFAEDEAEFNAYYEDMVAKAEGLGINAVLEWGVEAWAEARIAAASYE